MNKIVLGSAALCVFILTSCSSYRSSYNAISPGIQWNIHTEDLVFLGDYEGQINYTTYLGIPATGRPYYEEYSDTINGRFRADYDGEVNILSTREMALPNGTPQNKVSVLVSRLIEEYPDAEVLVPIYTVSRRYQMFLGSRREVKVKIKVYKFKN